MSRPRRNFDREFRDGAVRIVKETGRPAAPATSAGFERGLTGDHSNWLNRTEAGGFGCKPVERLQLV